MEDGPAETTDKLANGQSCITASACQSDFCADGVCCTTACTEICSRCNQTDALGTCTAIASNEDPDSECGVEPAMSCGTEGTCDGTGRCKLHPTGTECAPSSCSNGVVTHARTCDGAGLCREMTTSDCNPFVCGPTVCLTTCDGNEDCLPPNTCVGGSCRLKPLGADCSAAVECASNLCQQGVCCSTTCDRACQSCAVAGARVAAPTSGAARIRSNSARRTTARAVAAMVSATAAAAVASTRRERSASRRAALAASSSPPVFAMEWAAASPEPRGAVRRQPAEPPEAASRPAPPTPSASPPTPAAATFVA